MKIRELMKLQNVAVLFVLAALAFLALRASTLTAGAALEGLQQGQGRKVARQSDAQTTQPSDAGHITLDEQW